MTGRKREDALSELIGFILLLGLMVIIASLYLTYGVPANGREDEIGHMDYIKQQFLDYKIAADSLWINNAEGVAITQAITLGTQGIKTTGMFGGFNLFRPVFSSGTISINQDDNYIPEPISISVTNPLYSSTYVSKYALNKNNYALCVTYPETSFPSIVNLGSSPSHLYINFSTPEIIQLETPKKIRYLDSPSRFGVFIKNSTPNSIYSIKIQAVPKNITLDYNWTNLSANPKNSDDEYWIRYQTDLILSIIKNGISILDYPVSTNILSNTNYTIDLMEPAYGLSQYAGIFSNFSSQNLTSNKNFLITYSAKTGYINTTIQKSDLIILHPTYTQIYSPFSNILGRLVYSSQNQYYKIQENFIYQMGGVFVNQTEGATPLDLPSISIDPSPGTYWKISIIDISLDGEKSISGSSPVQVSTKLANIGDAGLDTSIQNTASVIISIQDTDQVDLWKSIFKGIVKNAGLSIDNSTIILSSSISPPVILTINGPSGSTDITTRDLMLDARFVNFNVELDPVSQSIGI